WAPKCDDRLGVTTVSQKVALAPNFEQQCLGLWLSHWNKGKNMIDHSRDEDVSADDDEASQRSYLRWLRLRFLKRYARRGRKLKAEKANEAKLHNEQTSTVDRSSC
ncbi:MAG TPA: hypothetical protein VMX38_05920, partial [Verrucomicrobiae bacterium]|nr:hypothetical protein [Verrucomicrobiae bacterium]